jgi:DNA repair photolyase
VYKISEYAPLGKFLEGQALNGQNNVILSFKDIESIISRKLPPTARKNKNWWANSKTEKSRQCSAWLNYGWRKEEINLIEEMVVFVLAK